MMRFVCALVSVFFAAASVAAEDRFKVSGTALIYDSRVPGPDERVSSILYDDIDELLALLRANDQVTELHLNSEGGGYYAAFEMADIVADFELDTHVLDICTSSCTYLLLGGAKRTMERGGRIGFHRTSWSAENMSGYFDDNAAERGWESPFEMASWNYGDTQFEVYERLTFMTKRGVDPVFAIETLRPDSNDMWYPYRPILLGAGVLTE